MSDSDPREEIEAVLQKSLNENEMVQGEGGGMVVGWVLISEWMSSKGDRWISRMSSENLTQWQRSGYLWYMLNAFDKAPEQ
jgi:hypothetical protein